MNESGRTHGSEFPFGDAGEAGRITALRADFVMKPEATGQIQARIEETLQSMKKREDGFLQGVVLVSDQEARLGTLITFWNAKAFEATRHRKIRWMERILKPYVDRCLRVQTQRTFLISGEQGTHRQSGNTIFYQTARLLEPEEAVCAS